jgi:hypothetical protein
MRLCTHDTLREPNPDGRDLHPTAARAMRPLLLESLLEGSVRLRDLYRRARRETVDHGHPDLRTLLDTHYKEQVRLIDVLIDRARMWGGEGRILAGAFLADVQSHWDPRGRDSRTRMLQTLFDAHEFILSWALSSRGDNQDSSAVRDFAVGQVVLANEEQSSAVCALLGNRQLRPELLMQSLWISD